MSNYPLNNAMAQYGIGNDIERWINAGAKADRTLSRTLAVYRAKTEARVIWYAIRDYGTVIAMIREEFKGFDECERSFIYPVRMDDGRTLRWSQNTHGKLLRLQRYFAARGYTMQSVPYSGVRGLSHEYYMGMWDVSYNLRNL